jgi:hypothetical protein
MPVIIDCPKCSAKVQVVAGGAVKMHFEASSSGDLCSFTKTPSTSPPRSKRSAATKAEVVDASRRAQEQRVARMDAKRVRFAERARERLSKLSDEELRQLADSDARRTDARRRALDEKSAAPPKPAARLVCEVCEARVKAHKDGLKAHKNPVTWRWCRGGKPPTTGERAAGRAKQSIRAVSGGLPTLGR